MENNIITIEQVTAFKTSDGKLFENDFDAHDHQREINFEQNLDIIINDFSNEIPFFDDSKACKEFVMANKDKLKELFL